VSRRPSLPLRVLAGLAPLVLLLVLVEAGLWLAGVGGVDPADLALGFDPGVRYLVPDPARPGGWRTQFRESEEHEVFVAPKGEAVRVLLLGGSNTQTFPENVLAETLAEHDPAGRSFEVINLGRQGYGSERVMILLAQALVLEPDAVVIYSGHNEFVEAGFATELDERYGSAWLRALAGTLSSLRSYRALSAGLEPAERPADVRQLDPAEREIPFAQTLLRYEAYRANLTRMVGMCREAGVPVVLCTVISNLLSPPYVATVEPPLSPADGARLDALLHQGEMRIPRPYRENLRPARRLRLSSWYRGAGVELGDGLPQLATLLGPLADVSATAGDEVKQLSMWGAHWPPPRLWEPRVLELLTTIEAVMQRRLGPPQVAALALARDSLSAALELAPDHPVALWDLGLVTWLLGEDDARAVELLRAAQSADRSPHGGNDRSNAVVRAVAAAEQGCWLFDARELFGARCPAGLVGYELVLDSCHLAPGARVVLLRDLARFLRLQLADVL